MKCYGQGSEQIVAELEKFIAVLQKNAHILSIMLESESIFA